MQSAQSLEDGLCLIADKVDKLQPKQTQAEATKLIALLYLRFVLTQP